MTASSAPTLAPARQVRTPIFWGLVFGTATVLLSIGFWFDALSMEERSPARVLPRCYCGRAQPENQLDGSRTRLVGDGPKEAVV